MLAGRRCSDREGAPPRAARPSAGRCSTRVAAASGVGMAERRAPARPSARCGPATTKRAPVGSYASRARSKGRAGRLDLTVPPHFVHAERAVSCLRRCTASLGRHPRPSARLGPVTCRTAIRGFQGRGARPERNTAFDTRTATRPAHTRCVTSSIRAARSGRQTARWRAASPFRARRYAGSPRSSGVS